MRRLVSVSILMVAALLFAHPTVARPAAGDTRPDKTTTTQTRLVVFESFMRPT
jgi:hypothetical protein